MTHRHTLRSPLGPLTLTADDRALVRLDFGGTPDTEAPPTPLLREAARQIDEYFAGLRRRFSLPLAPDGTPFQQEVWRALEAIPHGATDRKSTRLNSSH